MRVYEDKLLVIGAAGSERIGFAFVDAAGVRDYAVVVQVAGREPLVYQAEEPGGLAAINRAD